MAARLVTLAVLTGMLMLAGCSRVSKENYDRVQDGMTTQQVIDILGQPSDKSTKGGEVLGLGGSTTTMTWRHGQQTITARFVNDKLISKEYTGK